MDEEKENLNLNNKILSGVFWNFLNLLINRATDFLIKLILVKLLLPEQFGIVGMATVFISFVQMLNEMGIGSALIQKKEELLTEAHYHTAFWTGTIWSLILYLIMCFGIGPFAAFFYNEPILRSIVPVLSIGILASPINMVHRALLTKNMAFRKLMLINNTSTIISGVFGVILAILHSGVWSLIAASVSSYIIAIPLYFKASNYLPKLIWDKKAFRELFNFGIYATGTNLFNNLINKLDYLLIGKFVNASALGAYTFAFLLTDSLRTHFMRIFNNVMYPVYGQKQDDIISIKKYYLKVVKYNCVLIYPAMVILIVLGEPIVVNLFGDKWHETVQPLKILAVAVMFQMMVNSHTALIRGIGKPQLEMKIQMFKSLFIFGPAVFIGTYFYGIVGAAYAVLINKISAVFIAQYLLRKLIGINIKELLLTLKGPLLSSIISLVFGLILYYLKVNFILCGLLLLSIYVLFIWLLMKKELKILIFEINNFRKRSMSA